MGKWETEAAIRWNRPSHYWGLLRFPSDTWPTPAQHTAPSSHTPAVLYVEISTALAFLLTSLTVCILIATLSVWVIVCDARRTFLTLCGKVNPREGNSAIWAIQANFASWRRLKKQTKHYCITTVNRGRPCISAASPEAPSWHLESSLYVLYCFGWHDDFADDGRHVYCMEPVVIFYLNYFQQQSLIWYWMLSNTNVSFTSHNGDDMYLFHFHPTHTVVLSHIC